MNPPSYEIRAVHDDGSSSTPEIIPINAVPWEARADRRSFLGSGLAIASVLATAVGCSQQAGKEDVKFKVFNTRTNTWEFKTLPCGSPIPPGAICTCNCVPAVSAPPPRPITHTFSSCTCNQVCTCVPVYR